MYKMSFCIRMMIQCRVGWFIMERQHMAIISSDDESMIIVEVEATYRVDWDKDD